MSTVTGQYRSVYGDGINSLEAGRYAGTPTDSRTSSIECPYCHQHLVQFFGEDLGRISLVIKGEGRSNGGEAIIDPIPSTHAILRCMECQVVFTSGVTG